MTYAKTWLKVVLLKVVFGFMGINSSYKFLDSSYKLDRTRPYYRISVLDCT